jgi:hypothetical protein
VAVAVHSSTAGSSEPELGSSPVQADPAPAQQQQQQQQQKQTRPRNPRTQARQRWDYKYKWQPCPSLCVTGDERCFKVEALIQNVLSYPNMPPKICRHLPGIRADLDSMTALLEAMSAHFGKELTLLYVNKYPSILELDFPTFTQRVKAFRELCGVLESDVPMLLRKFPGLVTLDPQEMRTRYDNLRDLTRFNNQEVSAGRGALCEGAVALQALSCACTQTQGYSWYAAEAHKERRGRLSRTEKGLQSPARLTAVYALPASLPSPRRCVRSC